MMNGVFFMDAIRDWPFSSLANALDYARHYYARYPALSLGHHPPLVALLEAPMFAVFGVSIGAARLVSILCFTTAVVFLYRLVTDLFDEWSGAVAALVLTTSHAAIVLSQSVMTEIPALALLVMAAFYTHRFTVTEQSRNIFAAAILAGLSVWAKQVAVLAALGLVAYLICRVGVRRLCRGDAIVALSVAALIALPMIPLTLAMSPLNVAAVARNLGNPGPDRLTLAWEVVHAAARLQLQTPIWLLGMVGLASLAWRRHAAFWLFAGWILASLGFVTLFTLQLEPERYSIYWLPAWAGCVGALCAPSLRPRAWMVCLPVGVALLLQAIGASQVRIAGASGYEDVARYVVTHPRASTVLFLGDVDSGYFSFFVRKHDSARKAIVLRADKVFTTSWMGAVAAKDRIAGPEEIPAILQRLGVGYIVAEDWPSQSRTLNWLHQDIKTSRYAERLRVKIRSNDSALAERDLAVYEILDAGPAAPDARLDIQVPLVSREFGVAISDLINRKYFRGSAP